MYNSHQFFSWSLNIQDPKWTSWLRQWSIHANNFIAQDLHMINTTNNIDLGNLCTFHLHLFFFLIQVIMITSLSSNKMQISQLFVWHLCLCVGLNSTTFTMEEDSHKTSLSSRHEQVDITSQDTILTKWHLHWKRSSSMGPLTQFPTWSCLSKI